MRTRLLALALAATVSGCATAVDLSDRDLTNSDIAALKDNPLGTYSDYGKPIKFNDQDGLYHLDVYVGALGSCDGGAMLYAKPKLDAFMEENRFSSYRVVKGKYSLVPLSKCELFVQFIK